MLVSGCPLSGSYSQRLPAQCGTLKHVLPLYREPRGNDVVYTRPSNKCCTVFYKTSVGLLSSRQAPCFFLVFPCFPLRRFSCRATGTLAGVGRCPETVLAERWLILRPGLVPLQPWSFSTPLHSTPLRIPETRCLQLGLCAYHTRCMVCRRSRNQEQEGQGNQKPLWLGGACL